ncbi:MAG: Fic family protein [Clostridia bacterium]|nr:Fic family protein [Clostridia bacterium]
MSYKDLKKLFHSNVKEYKEAYTQRFSSENAVKLDFYIGKNQAFFIQSSEVVDLLYRILSADKRISSLTQALPGSALSQYSKKCLIDEIVITNNIEGVHSSRKEIGDALKLLEERSEKKGKKLKFQGIVNKYRKLAASEQIKLETCEDIRALYDELVLEEVVGDDKKNAPDGLIFRKGQTEVFNSVGVSVHKGKYPESEIITSMEKALIFLNDESVLPLYRICVFHYLLEYVHPFYDGNGRLGRFITSCRISENLEKLLAFRISQTIKENIRDYYKAFTVCNDPLNLGDLTPFLIMMLEMIAESADSLISSLQTKLNDWNKYLSLGESLLNTDAKADDYRSLLEILLRASLFSETGACAKELTEELNVSYSTLPKKLAFFKEKNLLAETKRGNSKLYSLDLNALNELI